MAVECGYSLSQLAGLGELGQIALAQFLKIRKPRHRVLMECATATTNDGVVDEMDKRGWRRRSVWTVSGEGSDG